MNILKRALTFTARFLSGGGNGDLNKDLLKNSLLLLVDLQNDYFPGGNYSLDGSEQAAINAGKLLNFYRENKLPVVHIQHINTDSKANFFLENSRGVEIHHSVKPVKDEKVMVKHLPDSFSGTGLEKYLKDRGVKNIVMAGMQTNVCMLATASRGKELNYRVMVIEDGAAALRDSVHKSTIKVIKDSFAEVLSSDYFLSRVV